MTTFFKFPWLQSRLEEAAREAEKEKEAAVAAALATAEQEAETEKQAAIATALVTAEADCTSRLQTAAAQQTIALNDAETDCMARLQTAAAQQAIALNDAVSSAESSTIAAIRTGLQECTARTPDGTILNIDSMQCIGADGLCGPEFTGAYPAFNNAGVFPCLPVELLP